ncbi:MAG: class F sortase [Candidatus Taylorbacteria bacterium]|nr:class F sortase [Candidatus Taylorbacteria bacterium]
MFFFSKKSALSLIGAALLLVVVSFVVSGWARPVFSNGLVKETVSELPFRLMIPKINVDAAIERVGLTEKGSMDAPKNPGNVGWFDLGSRPGEKGSSVIDGHSGWINRAPAVFDDLYKLNKGDKLYVQDEKGLVTTFVVHGVRIYGEHEDASNIFDSKDGKAHLNLITCEGIWDKISQKYSGRLVIFSDKEVK